MSLVEKLAPAGVFGYAAGKSIIAKRLVGLFPTHDVYTEPFCGSAALYFTKGVAGREVLNDTNEDVVDALKSIQSITKSELADLGARDWIGSAKQFEKVLASAPSSRVDRLYKFLYLTNFSYCKNRKRFNPDREGVLSSAAKRVERFQPRMKGTIITRGDYEKALLEHDAPEAFHFIDPPYGGYDIGVGERDFDESRLRKTLDRLKGRFLVTYGARGKLDTSGYEVKRMRQARTSARMRGVGGPDHITHLLISNYKVARKGLGAGIELDDVVQIVDVDETGQRVMVNGSNTSVSVPGIVTSSPAAARGVVQARFIGKRIELELELADRTWVFDVGRPLVGDRVAAAKTFTPGGSRFFAPLVGAGARASEPRGEGDVVKLADVEIEHGLVRDNVREFFLKGDVAGVLRLELPPDVPLAARYPWLATLYDRWPNAAYNFDVLKADAPLPPPGASALPTSLAALVPPELRFWAMKGDDATTARAALASTGLFSGDRLALVDGELRVVTSKLFLETPELVFKGDVADVAWPLVKAASLMPGGCTLVEVFSPDRAALAKAEAGAVVYCDVGDALPGTIELLATGLRERSGDFVVSAFDTMSTRAALAKLGPVFRFRPGAHAPVEAVKRLFVSSVAVHDDVEWIGKASASASMQTRQDAVQRAVNDRFGTLATTGPGCIGLWVVDLYDDAAVFNQDSQLYRIAYTYADGVAMLDGEPERVERTYQPIGKAEWTAAYVNDLPDSAFLFIESGGEKDDDGKTKPRSLRHFPVRDKDGAVDAAHAQNAIARIPQSTAPGLDAGKKKTLQDKARTLLASAQKAKPKATFTNEPSDDSPDLGKGDVSSGDLARDGGELVPSQRRRKLEVRLIKAREEDERIVYGIVLEPDVVDAQQDRYTADTIRVAAHEYMERFQNTGLMHKTVINDRAKVIESFLAPSDYELNGQTVKAGSWVMAMRVLDDDLWAAAKRGDLGGFSIGGSAKRIPIDEARGK